MIQHTLSQRKGFRFIAIGAVLGFLSVVFGAFGAHVVKSLLTNELFTVYETAVQYQFYHSIALLIVGALLVMPLTLNSGYLQVAAISFVLGILLFSGSLYVYAFTGIKKLGIVTPIGGVLFLAGWLMLALSAKPVDAK